MPLNLSNSPVDLQDEGTASGSADTYNFVGYGVDTSVSGSVATVTISNGIGRLTALRAGWPMS